VLELLVPLKANGHLAGLLYIGPFRKGDKTGQLPPGTLVSNGFCKAAIGASRRHLLPELSLETADRLLKMSQLLVFKMQSVIQENPRSETAGEPRRELIERFLNCAFRDSGCSLSKLADFLTLSESRTTQILREEFQDGFSSLLNKKRIDYAATLLERTYFSASQISAFSGFHAPAYFFRVFRKLTGMTAVEYRKKHAPAVQALDRPQFQPQSKSRKSQTTGDPQLQRK
jgi:AraC-like DNA-binding protein